ERRNFQFAAQGGGGEADRHLAVQVVAVAGEDRVGRQFDLHVQVPGRSTRRPRLALAREANLVAFVDTGRHLDLESAGLADPTLAVAVGARIADDLATAAALRARLLDGEEALLHAHLPLAAAGGTGHGRRARPGAGAAAGFAAGHRR